MCESQYEGLYVIVQDIQRDGTSLCHYNGQDEPQTCLLPHQACHTATCRHEYAQVMNMHTIVCMLIPQVV
jgi:hypothetical protein